MDASPPEDVVAWEDLIYVADFLEASGERHLSILGGEPALHPHFVEMLLYLLERGFAVRAFTSGIWGKQALEQAEASLGMVSPERLSFVCNLNNPRQSGALASHEERLRSFLRSFGPHVVPAFTIYRADFELEFLFQLVNEYGLQRSLRLGLANPSPGQANAFVSPSEVPAAISRLFSYAEHFERMRLRMGLDCGFPLCQFSDAQLAWLYRYAERGIRFGCGPAIDIGPDLSVWSCFPLSTFHKKSLFEFDSLTELVAFFQNKLSAIRVEAGGIFDQCDECRFREEGVCSGGCAAHVLDRLQSDRQVRPAEVCL